MVNGTIYLYKNFLCHILRIPGILNNTDSGIKNAVLVRIYQKLKCGFIAVPKSLYQFLFVQPYIVFFEAVTYENMRDINGKNIPELIGKMKFLVVSGFAGLLFTSLRV